jgi:serine protease Do
MGKKKFLLVCLLAGLFFGSVFSIAPIFAANPVDPISPSFGEKLLDLSHRLLDWGGNLFSRRSAPVEVPEYKPVAEYESAVVSAVESAFPAVVSIIVSKDVPVLKQCPYNPFSGIFGQGFEFYYPCPSGETKLEQVGGGSGFIVSSDGLILTNKHVVEDAAASYTVFSNDGRSFEARVVARDASGDLALVKIEVGDLPAIRLGDSDAVKLGQTAIAIGNALGEYRNTVSVGVISGIGRNVSAASEIGVENIEGVLQTDAAINPGNSGGPLLNLRGEVVGINTAMAVGAENIGFAIPINIAKPVLASFQTNGRIVVPFLGVHYQSTAAGAELVAGAGSPAVVSGSPAEKAGLKEGDVITAINGRPIDAEHSLANLIRNFSAGETVTLQVKRGDQILNLTVVLEEKK